MTALEMLTELAAEMKASGIDAAMRLAESKYGITEPEPKNRESIRAVLLGLHASKIETE